MGMLSLVRNKKTKSLTEYEKLQLLPCTICRDKRKRLDLLRKILNVKCDICGRRICTKCASKIYRRKGTRKHHYRCPFCLAALAHDKGGLKVYTDWKDK